MNKKIIPILIAVVIIAGGAGFFAGMKYGQSKSSATVRGTSGGFANLSPEERQVRMQQFGGVVAGGQRILRSGDGFTTGEILAKDDTIVTLKLLDGGSKIILYTTSTPVMKFSAGSFDDLKVGENITVTGTANQDGSITAQSIQLRSDINNL